MKINIAKAIICLLTSTMLHASQELTSWNVSGDFLWMKVDESNLIWENRTVSEPLDSNDRMNIPGVFNYHWNPAFRIAAAYNNQNDWSLGINWTHVNTSAKDSVSAPFLTSLTQIDGALIFGNIFYTPYGIYNAFEASAKLKFRVDWADFSLSKSFNFTNGFVIKTQIGARGLWRNHTYKVKGFVPASDVTSQSTLDFKLINPTYSYGLQAAIIGSYDLGWNLTFEGLFGGAILASQHKVSSNTKIVTTDLNVITQNNFSAYKRNTCDPMLDISAKLIYDLFVYGVNVQLHGGWEQHVIFNAFQGVRSGNVTLSALDVGLTVLF